MPGELEQLRARHLRRGIDMEALRRIGPAILSTDLPVGIPRDQVTVPISPDGRVNDTVLFEDPADANRHYYLPRYRLRVTPATSRYEITTELVGGQWRMTFGLESFPADEITATGQAASILPHELQVSVTSGAQLTRDYPVAEFSPGFGDTQGRPEVVLLLTLAERDELLRAFTRDEDNARIEVRRSISVAVPAAPPRPRRDIMTAIGPDSLGTHVILPDLVVADLVHPFPEPIRHFEPIPGHPGPDPDNPDPIDFGRLPGPGGEGVDEGADIIDSTTRETVDTGLQVGDHLTTEALATGGLRQVLVVDSAFARTAVATDAGLAELTFRQPRAPGILRRSVLDTVGLRDAIRHGGILDDGGIVFQPGGGGIVIDPFPFPDPTPEDPAPVQRYSVVASTHVDNLMLRFDVDAHPYLFPSGQPAGGGGGFATIVVPWPAQGLSSRNHVYFHDEAAGNVFYYPVSYTHLTLPTNREV